MEDPNQYPVFFECPDLDREKRRKIESYFHIRRRSGGGECGVITRINDKVYSVAFKEREGTAKIQKPFFTFPLSSNSSSNNRKTDLSLEKKKCVTVTSHETVPPPFTVEQAQQRVLERSNHVLEFSGDRLVLTVRSSPGPHDASPVTAPTPGRSAGAELDSTPSRQSTLSSSLPGSGEEYELQPDAYLLLYLKGCPRAWRELERELASVGCSAQLYPEDERLLVRSLAQPGAVDDGGNWKAEVDKLLDGYMCHYEVDPRKVKALLQSCRSHQTTDEVKVFSEAGVAVVVGKRCQVNARLMDVEDSTFKHRGSNLNEQTSIRRLGEAKLCLLWKNIECGLAQHFPGLKVSQRDAGQVVLEGSVTEILEAGDWISDKEKLVLERRVSNLSPHLLTFLRKAYGTSRVLGDFLGVGEGVEIELRDTELRFFSLSADAVDEAAKKMQEKFKDVKIDLPTCSSVLPEIREKLRSKKNELNQEQPRAQVLFGSESTVCLVGHTSEVEELSETVTQLILDLSSTEGRVILPFPELVQLLPELLQLHKFAHSEVTFSPLVSSSRPMVVLKGPSHKVTEVRNRLGPFLDSLVQVRVNINLPGAIRYFESPSGQENICRVAHSHKCLIQLQEEPDTTRQNLSSGARLSNGGTIVASYSLCNGLQVLVCQGDITKQEADALVNAANENLDHCGGVAAALSKAGGPEVQIESSTLVKINGKIPTGDVVVTTGGKLNCKKLLHAVGPVAGFAGGRERALLEKAVMSALNMAEMMKLKSIAMPCISSGLFGVPVHVCSEAIVTAVKDFASLGAQSLSRVILIDNRGEVVSAMQYACDRLLQGISTRNSTPGPIPSGHTTSDLGSPIDAAADDTAKGATAGAPGDGVHVEIVQGTIETQQVDALVAPVVGCDPMSTRIGHVLSKIAGPQLAAKFHKGAGKATIPGDIVMVEGLHALQSKAVFFIELISWDDNQHETVVQVLRQGLRKILSSCETRGLSSVALPVLGTGAVLQFPHSMASRVILEEVQLFQQNRASRSPFFIHVVIHPQDKESCKAFQSAQETLHLRGFSSDSSPDKVSFYRRVSESNDEVTAMLGPVKLQMVCGDIVNESTDVIVNTVDFSSNQSGVSKAILTAGGPALQAEFAQVGIPKNNICTTGPGLLSCSEIFHACFMRDPQVIRKNCKKILEYCEGKHYRSIAFPAINTGGAGMDCVQACAAMLDGIQSAIRDLKPNSLSLIRIIILQQPVFQAFRSELDSRLGQIAQHSPNLRGIAKQCFKKLTEIISRTLTYLKTQGKTLTSSNLQPAVISVICCGEDIVETIKRDLEGILQKQLVEREVDVQDFSKLNATELDAVLAKIRLLGISLEQRRCPSSESANGNRNRNTAGAEASYQSGSGKEVYLLTGLKEDVLSVTELVNGAVRQALFKDIQDNAEKMLARSVQWSLKDVTGTWENLSLHDNYVLEDAQKNNQVSVDVMAPDGMVVKVNLRAQEATDWQTGISYKVKRSESGLIAALDLPPQWEPMDKEDFKKFELQPNSPEYKAIAKGFHETAKDNIQKIERVQNLFLWQAYALCRQRILAKNGQAQLEEKILYHGTAAKICTCIEKGKFDRSFAGTHGSMHGMGVYFAVNAEYSARNFSPADASGLKRLYVARVVTGRHTVGTSAMKSPPPRGTDPSDCFDSLVDKLQQPSMFVIFHDDQAYPEYLITFK